VDRPHVAGLGPGRRPGIALTRISGFNIKRVAEMLRWVFTALTLVSTVLAIGAVARGSAEERLAIQRIEVRVVRSMPPQVFVRVHGVELNGCTHLDAIEQHRDGKVVTLTIPIHTTGEVCTMMARLVDETIRLEGEFTRGRYTVNVNGVSANFRV
jgi:hypothetical protein